METLKLCYGIMDIVQEGKANVGDYLLGDRNLGKEVTIVFGPFRPHAIHICPKEKKRMAESYLKDSDEFKRLQREAKKFTKGFKAGPEYLVWIPEIEEFALLYFARSTLKLAKDVGKFGNDPVVLTYKLVKAKNTYPVYDFKPFEGDPKELAKPTKEQAEEAAEQFQAPLNVTKSAVEER